MAGGVRVNTECGHTNIRHYARGHCYRCYANKRHRGEFAMAKCIAHACRNNGSGSSPYCRDCGDMAALMGLPVRFWHYVVVADDTPGDDPCWIWTGCRPGFRREGAVWSVGDENLHSKHSTFEAYYNRSTDFFLTHTCRNIHCVNPRHLLEANNREACNNQRQLPTSGVRGAYPDGDRWVARARTPESSYSITVGYFDTAEEAGRAYEEFVSGIMEPRPRVATGPDPGEDAA